MPRTGSIGSKVGPAVMSTRFADQRLGLEEGDQFLEQFLGLEHAAVADLAAGPSPAAGPSTVAPSARCAEVALRAGCAHISRFIAGATSSGQRVDRPRQAQEAEQIVGAAVQQLGDEVGAGRRDEHRIGLAREVDVRHVVGRSRIPLARVDLAVDSACSVTGVMNCCAASVITTCTLAPSLASARELRGLVAGDAARQAEHDVPKPASWPLGHHVHRQRGIHARDQSEKLNSTRTALP